MPIYEYACGKCDHEFEVEQRITDDPIKTCPECRSRKVKKLISQTSFVLKGGGWHSDLYSSSKKKSDESDASAAPKSESSSESKSETKSDTKSETKGETKSSSDSDSKPKGKSKGSPKAAA